MKCKYCGNQTRWLYNEHGWYSAEMDGSYHSCNAGKILDQSEIKDIQESVSVSDKWKADKFIKRLALYRYLYPRKRLSYTVFTGGTDSDRDYLIRCSDKAFDTIMKRGTTGILQNRGQV